MLTVKTVLLSLVGGGGGGRSAPVWGTTLVEMQTSSAMTGKTYIYIYKKNGVAAA